MAEETLDAMWITLYTLRNTRKVIERKLRGLAVEGAGVPPHSEERSTSPTRATSVSWSPFAWCEACQTIRDVVVEAAVAELDTSGRWLGRDLTCATCGIVLLTVYEPAPATA